MAKDNNSSYKDSSPLDSPQETNKSFVRKVQSRVSGLLSTSLSKWFHNDDSKSRQRDEEEDEEDTAMQPPPKKIKKPAEENNIEAINMMLSFVDSEPGPSGVKTQKHFIPSNPIRYSPLNGDKDSDSGESTSGYSSLIRLSQKDAQMKTQNPFSLTTSPVGQSRSLFTERSLSPQLNSSLSSRRPSFNASTFGSPSFVDRTLSTKRIINSPFYGGRTMYGGAAAYSFQQQKKEARRAPKNQIQVKPVNQSTGEDVTLSKTARRILNTLEEFASPINDAKKIPVLSQRKRHDALLSKYTGANPYLLRHTASNRELQIPSVPDLLKMKLKERLQESTVAVRQIATTSKSTLNNEEYKIRTLEENTPKYSNKIKSKITTTRHKPVESNPIEEFKLPEIPLPITTLPKFDFSLPLPTTPSTQPLVTVACTESKPIAPTDHNLEFKFSNPLVLAENLISIIAINDFKFSEPVFKNKLKRKSPIEVNQPPIKELCKLDKSTKEPTLWECSSCLSKNLPDKSKCLACETLRSSSTDEKLSQFKLTPNKWECSSCLVRNNLSESFCVACSASKPLPTSSDTPIQNNTTSSFGEKFKKKANEWECLVCLIRNANDRNNCLACENPREAPSEKKPTDSNSSFKIPNENNQRPNKSFDATKLSDFGEAFKKKASEWECSICLIRNSNDKEKCLACENPKLLGDFGSKFKQKEGEWQCSSCYVRNAKEMIKCQACENLRPPAFGDAYKKKGDEWDCSACLVRNKKEVEKCVACGNSNPTFVHSKPVIPKAPEKPQNETKDTPIFTFGIFPPETKELVEQEVNKSEVVFGVAPLTSVVAPSTPFVFGIPKSTASKPIETPVVSVSEVKPSAPSAFVFGTVPPKNEVKPILQDKVTQEKTVTGGFSLGSFASTTEKPNFGMKPEEKKQVPSKEPPIIFAPPKQSLPVSIASKTVVDSPLLKKPEKNVFSIPKLTTAPPATTSFTFMPSTTAAPLFNFGAKSTPSIIFGTPRSSTGFGGVTTTTTTIPTPSVSATTTTTNAAAAPSSSTDAPLFNFNQTEPVAPFGSSAPIFGNPASVPPKSVFEPPPTVNQPSFGSFGSEVKPFSFEAPPSETKAPTFSFGQGNKPPEVPKAPTFNFGGALAQPAPSAAFMFNTAPPPLQNPTPALNFNFNPSKVDNSTPFQAPNIFGAPQQQPPMQNGGFNFGAPSSSKPAFSFNAPPPQQVVPSGGLFSFGATANNPHPPQQMAQQEQQQPSGGFNFGAPAFDANIKPSFNFSGGATPVFSAQPTTDGPVVQQRKKIRGVRRNQR